MCTSTRNCEDVDPGRSNRVFVISRNAYHLHWHPFPSSRSEVMPYSGLNTPSRQENFSPIYGFFLALVSPTDQTIAYHRVKAEVAGFKIGEVVSSVTTPLADRVQSRRLFYMLRRGDVLVVRWVNRLGRDYADVTETIREFVKRGINVKTVINAMTFDGSTTDPVQMAVRDALIAFMAATAQAQAEATKSAQTAGIAHAKSRNDAYLGRKPSYTRAQLDEVVTRLNAGEAVQAMWSSTASRRSGRLTVLPLATGLAAVEVVEQVADPPSDPAFGQFDGRGDGPGVLHSSEGRDGQPDEGCGVLCTDDTSPGDVRRQCCKNGHAVPWFVRDRYPYVGGILRRSLRRCAFVSHVGRVAWAWPTEAFRAKLQKLPSGPRRLASPAYRMRSCSCPLRRPCDLRRGSGRHQRHVGALPTCSCPSIRCA